MANEAVIIELAHDSGEPLRFTCADGTSISKGTLLKLTDPRTVAATSASADPFAGIAAHDKIANDGSTSITVYTKGIFDLLDNGGAVTAGNTVATSGANIIRLTAAADFIAGSVIGQALETVTSGTAEVIAVRISPGGI